MQMDYIELLKKMQEFFEESTETKFTLVKQNVLHQESQTLFTVTIDIRQA